MHDRHETSDDMQSILKNELPSNCAMETIENITSDLREKLASIKVTVRN